MATINKSIPFEESTADEASLIQDQIQHYLNEIDLSHERMQRQHEKIEQSKTRTRTILAELAELRIA